MKKWFCLLVITMLVLSAVVAVADNEELTCGDYKYLIQEDGTSKITWYSGNDPSLEIPNALNGKNLTSIGDFVFKGCFMKSVTIPDSITAIGSNPFARCGRLVSIKVSPDHPAFATIDNVLFDKREKKLICYPCAFTDKIYSIPHGIHIIGGYAFWGCSSLTNIMIPDSVTSIGECAFWKCSSLMSITIPDSVTSIGGGAFFECSSLTSITISNSVTSIDNGAFSECSSLTNITIPDSVSSIGHSVFSWCAGLTNITIPSSITSIDDYAFERCSSLTNVMIPDSVTSIGDYVFSGCSSLTSITIPGSVNTIGKNTFYDCPNLTITVPRNSYAAQYCKDNNLSYTYPDANDWLNN